MTKSDINSTRIISLLPKSFQKYAILSRIDRPTGYLLLWMPIVWGIFASLSVQYNSFGDIAYISTITLIGSIAMRGAGCTWNDIADREFDKKVARTATRPVACGSVSVNKAIIYLMFQLLIGLGILLLLPTNAQIASLIAIIPAAIYPFMKRFTYWPQAWLGLTFNWGIWVGWLSFTSDALYIPLFMHIASIFWTLGYDTIYAHQDREDDLIAGVKSSALKLGTKTKPVIIIFYTIFALANIYIAYIAHYNKTFYFVFLCVIISLLYQIIRLDIQNAQKCLHLFKHNRITGVLITLSIISGVV